MIKVKKSNRLANEDKSLPIIDKPFVIILTLLAQLKLTFYDNIL